MEMQKVHNNIIYIIPIKEIGNLIYMQEYRIQAPWLIKSSLEIFNNMLVESYPISEK